MCPDLHGCGRTVGHVYYDTPVQSFFTTNFGVATLPRTWGMLEK